MANVQRPDHVSTRKTIYTLRCRVLMLKVFVSICLFGFMTVTASDIVLANDISVTYQIPISGETHISTCKSATGPGGIFECRGIARYIALVYQWVVAFAAVLAVLAFTYAGVLWLIAGGDSGKVNESKKIMGSAVAGLLIALGSYLLLAVINPDLVNFKAIKIPGIENIALDLKAAQDEVNSGSIGGCADGSCKAIAVTVTGCPGNATISSHGKTYTQKMFGDLWGDILCRSGHSFFLLSKSGEPSYETDVDAHESTHGLNAGGPQYYVGRGTFLTIPSTDHITLDMVVQHLPPSLQNGDKGRFDIYLNTKDTGPGRVAQQNNSDPINGIMDDFTAYNSNSKVFAEIYTKNLPGKSMGESGTGPYGPPSFTAYALALAQTLVDKDPSYLSDGNFKKNLKYLIEDGMKAYHDVEKIDASKTDPDSKKMYDALRSSPDAADLRALAKKWYGGTWTSTWLGF